MLFLIGKQREKKKVIFFYFTERYTISIFQEFHT